MILISKYFFIRQQVLSRLLKGLAKVLTGSDDGIVWYLGRRIIRLLVCKVEPGSDDQCPGDRVGCYSNTCILLIPYRASIRFPGI